MAAKPTYEELELRIEELERKAFERKFSEEALQASEGFFDILVSSVSVGVMVYDDKFRYKLWNQFMEKLTGMRADNVLGKIAFDLFPHFREEGIDKLLERALRGETVQSDDTSYHVPDTGKVGWATGLYSPHVDPSGNIVGVVGIVHDISDRKQAEDALRESESKLNAMLASIGDHISMLDKDLNIIWANEIAVKIFGNDIIGKKCYEVYHKRTEPCEPYPCITLRAFQDGKIYEHETQVIDMYGKSAFYHCTASVALRDKEGQPISVIEISRDITENVRAKNALQKVKDELVNQVEERTKDLEIQKNDLEEANIALHVLLEKRQEDKKEMEDNVLTNVKEMIAPYFKKIRNTKLNDQQKAILSILESYLNEIISPFARKMTLRYLNLTPTEIEVANLLRHGINSKEIADIMNLSPRTIYNHRKNIRKKFGLENQKTDLRSHLLSIY